jgi:hypothetical protein
MLGMAVLVVLLAAAPALAAPKGAFTFGSASPGTTGGLFNAPRDIAVRNANGDIYVVDRNNHRIQRFSASGDFELAWGWNVITSTPTGGSTDLGDVFEVCTIAQDCQAGSPGTATDGQSGRFDDPTGIAIDQTDGSVYVMDRDKRRIQKFTADGTFVLMFGRAVNQTTGGNVCTAASGDVCKVGTTGALFAQFGNTGTTLEPNIAVNPANGNVFAADLGNRRVMEFEGDGDFVRAFGWNVVTSGPGNDTVAPINEFEICVPANTDVCTSGTSASGSPWQRPNGQFVTGSPLDLAIGPNGILYVTSQNVGGAAIFRFDVTQSSPASFVLPRLVVGGQDLVGESIRVEVDADDNHVFVMRGEQILEGIHEIDPATDAILATHMAGAVFPHDNRGFGRNSADGSEYIALDHRILVLNETGAPPADVIVEPASDTGAHEATLNATITPNGPPGISASYQFELSENGVDWTPVSSPVNIGDGTSPVEVSQTVTDLEANKLYRVRVIVTKQYDNPPQTSAELFFLTDTVPPEVTTGAAQNVTSVSAQVRGRINPNNLPTTYYVEYGRTTAYGSQAPVPAGDAGSGGVERLFIEELTGLEPGKEYHYRFVATNAEGTTKGADRSFTTRALVEAPAGRAYEMVTPPDKNNRRGGAPLRSDLPTIGIPSTDGESIVLSLQYGILDGDAAAFPHTWDTVVMRRDADGWETDPLVNQPSEINAATGLTNAVGFSSDLNVFAWHHKAFLFSSGSALGTRVFGDTGGLNGSGWYDWLVDPANVDQVQQSSSDLALVDHEGDRLLRWGGSGITYKGLNGVGDPSAAQSSGDALYLQEPAGSGPRDVVHECTGTVADSDATLLPSRVDAGAPGADAADTIGTRSCEDGSITSLGGATAGGGLAPDPFRPGRIKVPSGPVRTAMSDDGARVVFTSPDPVESVPSACGSGFDTATDCPPQLYVRQYDSSGDPTVRWISRSAIPSQEVGLMGRGASFEGASADGQVVYFKTNAPLTVDDPNGTPGATNVTTGSASDSSWDIYRYEFPGDRDVDPAGGTLTRITGGPNGTDDPNVLDLSVADSGAAAVRFMSEDGQKVYFATRGPLDPGPDTDVGTSDDPWNASPDGGVTTPSAAGSTETRNLYLYDASQSGDDRWSFVAQLPASTSSSNVDACATMNAFSGMSQLVANDPSRKIGASCVHGLPDASVIAFETRGQLTADDEDGAGDLYLYDSSATELVRVSAPRTADDDGYDCGDGVCNATLGHTDEIPAFGDMYGLQGLQHANFAEDDQGRVSLFFETRLPLVAGDTNGTRMDVYRWRAGELSLVSPGDTDDEAYYSGNTLDGEDVFFATSQRIDPLEIDDDYDIYDARIGGGFPLPPAPTSCDSLSDGCQGAGTGTPVDAGRTSDGPGGGGNATAPERKTLSVSRPTGKALRRAARTGVLVLKVKASGAGRIRASAKTRLGGKSKTVATDAATARKAGDVRLRLRLGPEARRRLAAGKALRLVISVRMTDARTRSLTVKLERGDR